MEHVLSAVRHWLNKSRLKTHRLGRTAVTTLHRTREQEQEEIRKHRPQQVLWEPSSRGDGGNIDNTEGSCVRTATQRERARSQACPTKAT